eukprot:TRINITY_DN1776_c0_g2_i3.p3 TRINITY_DN1776_c0_g2~~TRINITY_DN1776_c0_g2_i3.p3  ORF type:complete len:287 (+),score=79.30 TRINITY_DN1776_c0_g2_i3:193-1053(+)
MDANNLEVSALLDELEAGLSSPRSPRHRRRSGIVAAAPEIPVTPRAAVIADAAASSVADAVGGEDCGELDSPVARLLDDLRQEIRSQKASSAGCSMEPEEGVVEDASATAAAWRAAAEEENWYGSRCGARTRERQQRGVCVESRSRCAAHARRRLKLEQLVVEGRALRAPHCTPQATTPRERSAVEFDDFDDDDAALPQSSRTDADLSPMMSAFNDDELIAELTALLAEASPKTVAGLAAVLADAAPLTAASIAELGGAGDGSLDSALVQAYRYRVNEAARRRTFL